MRADAAIANGFKGGSVGSAHAFGDPVFSFGPRVGSVKASETLWCRNRNLCVHWRGRGGAGFLQEEDVPEGEYRLGAVTDSL